MTTAGALSSDPAWPIIASYCGVPDVRWYRYGLLMLRAFIDDSGRGQPPAFVLGGYLSTIDRWLTFSREWAEELSTPRAVEYFKMSEAYRLTDQFDGHSRESVTGRVSRLITIIKRNVDVCFSVVLPYDMFEQILVPYFTGDTAADFGDMRRNPYFHCFYAIMASLLSYQRHRGVIEPIDFIFDQQGREGFRVREFWQFFRYATPDTEFLEMMSGEPDFEDSKKFLPLQAADLYAWHIRRTAYSAAGMSLGERPSTQAEMQELNTINRIETVLFDEARCRRHIAAIERFR